MFLLDRNFALILGVLFGFVLPYGAEWIEPLILPILGIVMTAAIAGMESPSIRSLGEVLNHCRVGIIMSYVVLSGTILLLNDLLIRDTSLYSGFILIAIVPPAVAVIPFSSVLRGNSLLSLVGTISAYVAALVIIPVTGLFFFGGNVMKTSNLLVIVVELILLPLAIGHLFRRAGMTLLFSRLKGPVTNWGFAFITYTVVGLNRSLFLSEPLSLVPSMIVIMLSTFMLGWIIETINRRILKKADSTIVSMILLGTLKNYGIAAGLALALFDEKTAAPSTLSAVVMIFYIIWLQWRLSGSRNSRLK